MSARYLGLTFTEPWLPMTFGVEGKRLFFALSPTEQCRRYLMALQRQISLNKGTFVPPENLHLTLVFLGHVAAPASEQLMRAADAVQAEPIDICLTQCTLWHRQQILWVGPNSTPSPLSNLVERLRQVQIEAGLAPEGRPYVPHVTLARRARILHPLLVPEPFCWHSDRFALMQSVAEPFGVRYRVVAEWRLGQ